MQNLNAYIFATNFVALISKDLDGTLVRKLGDGTFYLDKECFYQFTCEKESNPHVFQVVCAVIRAMTQQDELDVVREGLVVVDTVAWNEEKLTYESYYG